MRSPATVILINNVLALDLYVISRRATRGEEGALRWLGTSCGTRAAR